MNPIKISFLLFCFLCFHSCAIKQEQQNNILINIPTIEQEATSIWTTINDIEFLEKQGYQVNLPENELIQSLIEKSKSGKFGNENFPEIYNLLESNIYNKSNYETALKRVMSQKKLINKLIDQLYDLKKDWNWEFKTFENYNVIFTLYGTGGSYDPDLGTITLFNTMEGKFMNYDNPVNTIMHEIIHMGIEKSIVQKYKLSHGLKERVVDIITHTMFKKFLPEYKIQNMGDPKIDDFLKSKKDIENLDSIVNKFINEY